MREQIETMAQSWPPLDVDIDDFVAFVQARIDDSGEAVSERRLFDLYVTFGCLQGAETAVDFFRKRFDNDILALIRKTTSAKRVAEEAYQAVYRHLFVEGANGEPALARFLGRGSLQAFIRVVTVRKTLEIGRVESRELNRMAEAEAWELPATDDDPELSYLKALYRDEFRRAFAVAITELSDRDSALLRYHLVSGLSIDQIATIYRVHRATAARWLNCARDALVDNTRKQLLSKLEVGPDELDSILRIIQSNVDMSARRLLLESA